MGRRELSAVVYETELTSQIVRKRTVRTRACLRKPTPIVIINLRFFAAPNCTIFGVRRELCSSNYQSEVGGGALPRV